MPNNDYGHDRFIYLNGVRHRTVLARTLTPLGKETNADFELRMDHVAKQMTKMPKVTSVEMEFERRDGHLTQCLLIITHEPYPEFVTGDDQTEAGGRFSTPRRERKKAA